MNRRMRRARERAKFEAARQRALARLGEQWRQLQDRLRSEDVLEPLPPSMQRQVAEYAGTGRVLLVGVGGVTVPFGTASISFSPGPLAYFTRAPSCAEADRREREQDLAAARLAVLGSPADPWPCGDCMVETRQEPVPGSPDWRTVERTRTCDMCRAQGAPEYLP